VALSYTSEWSVSTLLAVMSTSSIPTTSFNLPHALHLTSSSLPMQSKQGMSREQPGAPGHTSLGIADKDSEGKPSDKGDNKKTLFKDPTSPKDANGNAKEPNALKLGDADQATQPSAVENPRAVTGDTSASAPQPVSNGGNAGMGGGVSAIFPPSLHGKNMVGKHDEAHHDRMDNPAPAGNNGNISNLVSNDNADMIDAAITIDQDYTPQNNGIEKLLGPQSNPMFPPSLEPKLPLPQHGAPAFGSSFGQGQHNLHHTGPSFGASGGGASNYATIDGPVTLPPPTTAYGTFGTNNHNSPVEVENSPGYGNMFSTATSGGLGAGLGGDGLGGGVNGYGGGNASGGLYPTLRFPAPYNSRGGAPEVGGGANGTMFPYNMNMNQQQPFGINSSGPRAEMSPQELASLDNALHRTTAQKSPKRDRDEDEESSKIDMDEGIKKSSKRRKSKSTRKSAAAASNNISISMAGSGGSDSGGSASAGASGRFLGNKKGLPRTRNVSWQILYIYKYIL